jgi:hypothetical protein
MRRVLSTVAGVALAGALLAGCGGGDRSIGIGQVEDTTTTSSSTSTTAAAVTTTTTAPPPVVDLPCTEDALRFGYVQTHGAPPAGSLTPSRCLAGWAMASLTSGVNAPVFVLFHAEGGTWVAKSEGVANVCEGHGVPPRIAPQIGCDT